MRPSIIGWEEEWGGRHSDIRGCVSVMIEPEKERGLLLLLTVAPTSSDYGGSFGAKIWGGASEKRGQKISHAAGGLLYAARSSKLALGTTKTFRHLAGPGREESEWPKFAS